MDGGENPLVPGLEADENPSKAGVEHGLRLCVGEQLGFHEATETEFDSQPALRGGDQAHQFKHVRVDVQLVVVEHEPGHAVGRVEMEHFFNDMTGLAHASAPQHGTLSSPAESTAEGAAELRDHGKGANAVDRIAVARDIHQVTGGKGKVRQLVAGEEQRGCRVVAVDDFRRLRAEGMEDREFAVADHEHIEHVFQLSPGTMDAAAEISGRFMAACRMDQGGMRAAKDDPCFRPQRSNLTLNDTGGRHLRSGRRKTVTGRAAARQVLSHHLFVVGDTREVQHFDREARLLQHGRDFQNSQRHEDALVQ